MLPNGNNLYGDLFPPRSPVFGERGAGWVASKLAENGWKTHKASWNDEWEADNSYADIHMVKTGDSVLLSGAIADFDESLTCFRGTLELLTIVYRLELYDSDGQLIKELHDQKT